MRSSAWHWEALGWSCTGLGVTVAGRAASVLRHARRTGSLAYFVLDVLVVSFFGGGGGGRGGAGYVWTVYEMACFLFHVQWTSSCDHAATSSAVLHRVSYDVGVVPQVQFIDRVLPRCEQRQVPTVAVFSAWVLVLQYIDKVVDVPGDAVALWRLVKEFHIFSMCCSRSSPGIWTLFLEPLVLAATCPVSCDSPRKLLDEFRLFST